MPREDIQDIDEEIAKYGDGSVILCTDGYEIYDGIEERDGVVGHPVINHSDHLVIGDPHQFL